MITYEQAVNLELIRDTELHQRHIKINKDERKKVKLKRFLVLFDVILGVLVIVLGLLTYKII